MSNEEEKIELGELHEMEKRLIFSIRTKYKYADMRIITKDGLPFRLKIVERFEDLSQNDNV